MADEKALVPLERIESRILLIRAQKVILDSDLAELYEVSTTRLNGASRPPNRRQVHAAIGQLKPQR